MFSLFSPSTAGNYAASFRQVDPISGFENVNENRFSEMFAKIPLEAFKQEMQMAQSALDDKAQMKRDKMQYEYYRERDAADARRNKISNILGMAKGAGAAGAQLLLPQKRDAYSNLLSYMQTGDAVARSRENRMAGSDAALISALKGLGPEPAMNQSTPSVDIASAAQATQFTTPQAAPAKLQDVTATLSNMDLMKQFIQYASGSGK